MRIHLFEQAQEKLHSQAHRFTLACEMLPSSDDIPAHTRKEVGQRLLTQTSIQTRMIDTFLAKQNISYREMQEI